MTKSKTFSIILNVSPGEHVEGTCKKAVEIADRENVTVNFNHNGIDVSVNPGTTAEETLSYWNKVLNDRRIAYINSPEGQKADKEQEEYKQKRREERKAGKKFSLREVLTQTTGLYFVNTSKGESHQDLFDFVYPENDTAKGFTEACNIVKEIVLNQYPELRNVDINDFGINLKKIESKKERAEYCKKFIKEQEAKFGSSLLIKGE